MKDKVPAIAPFVTPDIGESKKTRPRAAASLLNWAEAIGEIVLTSMIYAPFFADSNMPPG